MKRLQRGRSQFETWFSLVDEPGINVRATLQPVPETSVSVEALAAPRHLLRVRQNEGVLTRKLLRDVAGRVFLVGDHDIHVGLDRVYRLFLMEEQNDWTRATKILEPITGMQRSAGKTSLGTIWIAREQSGREQIDRGFRVSEDLQRVITGADVQLGDMIGGQVVKRIILAFGINVCECQ